MRENILNIEDLSIWYRTYRGYSKVVDHINLQVGKGEKIGLVGESGCGKTTTMKTVMGVLGKDLIHVPDGKIDFAVVSTPVKVKSPLEKTILCSFKEILIGGTDFEHIKDDNISLKNLKDYPLISLGQETTTYDFYNKIFLKYGIELNPDTEVATTDQIIPLVKSDLGMAFVPEPMARESIEKNEIVEISLKEKIPNREVCIVHDCQHPLNSAARKLKNEICSC